MGEVTEAQRAAYVLVKEHGGFRAAVRAANPKQSYASIYRKYQAAIKNGIEFSDGARNSVQSAGLGFGEAKGGHRRVYDEDGKQIDTVRWSVPQEQFTEEYLERIADVFSHIKPSPTVPAPETLEADMLNVLPLYDVHWGMAAWGRETGHHDYDFDLARDDVMRGLEAVLSRAPRAAECILLLGGDLLHADDDKAQTPGHHHNLDVAGRMHQACETLIAILKYTVTRVLEHHGKITVRVLRGNHDENSHRIVAFALREWLANNDRAEVDLSPRDLFEYQWGRSAIFGHHGDKSKPQEFTLKLADTCSFWSACSFRHAYTGHKHTHEAMRIGGLNWERLEPFAPADMYGANWTNRRGIKIDTYSKTRGRVNTAIDPLERG